MSLSSKFWMIIVILLLIVLFLAPVLPLMGLPPSMGSNHLDAGLAHLDQTKNPLRALQLDIPFVKNIGQSPDFVKFYTEISKGFVYILHNGQIMYSLQGKEFSPMAINQSEIARGMVLVERFMGGNVKDIQGKGKCPVNQSRFPGIFGISKPNEFPSYRLVDLGEVYPGIRIKLKTHEKKVGKLFCLEPGADPGKIRVKIRGAGSLKQNLKGELVVKSKMGNIIFTRPAAFQIIAGRYRPIYVTYKIRNNVYSFKVGKYNHDVPLIIDPKISAVQAAKK